MRQDPTFKDIFAYPFMVEEFLRWFVGDLHGARELVDGLDFSGLARVQEQSTTGAATDKRGYANDIVWQVPFRERTEADLTWLHIVVMIEVQGTVDYLMALRIRNYVCEGQAPRAPRLKAPSTTIISSCGVADTSARQIAWHRYCRWSSTRACRPGPRRRA